MALDISTREVCRWNFSHAGTKRMSAARELYCTQPALSYQNLSLEKELDLDLLARSATRVALTEAGRAFVPQAEGIYRSILNARTALKGFARRRTLTLRLPPVLLQRDPIYPSL